LAWNRREDVDWVATNTLLCGLGVGLQETFDYLLRRNPSFADFEAWILAQNGGAIDAARIERLNAGLSEAGTQGEPADQAAEPALSTEDIAFWDENGYVILHDAVPPEKPGCKSCPAHSLWRAGHSVSHRHSRQSGRVHLRAGFSSSD
jgi:hypothetical protein